MSISSLLYRDTLPSDVRTRYDRKIACIHDDLYTLKKTDFDGDVAKWPDVVNYSMFSQSVYTKEELKKYKSLEACTLFQDGWIRQIQHTFIGDLHLFVAKVLNSMSRNVTE